MEQKKKIWITVIVCVFAWVFFTKTGQKVRCSFGKRPGLCYGVAKLYEKNQSHDVAKEFYELDAKRGQRHAQNALGIAYYKGRGVPQDYTQAKYWFKKAAQQNHTNAFIWLGAMYYKGYGVKEDFTQAKKYYQQAVDNGDAAGLKLIGVMYEEGKGVEQSYTQAKKYYQQACNANDTEACTYLEEINKN